jgi:hypothetical protein
MRKLVGISSKPCIFIFLSKRFVDLIESEHVFFLRLFNTLPDFVRLILSQLGSGGQYDEVLVDAAFYVFDFFF